jgi:hypothetical protein
MEVVLSLNDTSMPKASQTDQNKDPFPLDRLSRPISTGILCSKASNVLDKAFAKLIPVETTRQSRKTDVVWVQATEGDVHKQRSNAGTKYNRIYSRPISCPSKLQ